MFTPVYTRRYRYKLVFPTTVPLADPLPAAIARGLVHNAPLSPTGVQTSPPCPRTDAEPHVPHNIGQWEERARPVSPGERRRERHDRKRKEGRTQRDGSADAGEKRRTHGTTQRRKQGDRLRRWRITTTDGAGKQGRWAGEVRSRETREKTEKGWVRGGPGLERPSPH
jgi:hypothetical protein